MATSSITTSTASSDSATATATERTPRAPSSTPIFGSMRLTRSDRAPGELRKFFVNNHYSIRKLMVEMMAIEEKGYDAQ